MHVIQRGNNRGNCFFCESDYLAYLAMLKQSADIAACEIHAYVLMTNHVHLLLTPLTAQAAPTLMKSLGERYVQYVNRRYGRAGTLWQGRYRSCLVQDETYFMVCQRYIDMNPVRASIVTNPGLYPWSSHRFYAYGDSNPVLTPHELVTRLGLNQSARQLAYRELCHQALSPDTLTALRDATNNNFAFGSPSFAERMASTLGRQVSRSRGCSTINVQ